MTICGPSTATTSSSSPTRSSECTRPGSRPSTARIARSTRWSWPPATRCSTTGTSLASRCTASTGIELSDFWRENRHQAYEGTSVPGFPNFFLTFGPYSTTSLSFLAGSEAGVRHAVRAIKEARKRGATWVEVSKQANDRYFQRVLSRMGGTAFFNNHCENANSYYFDARGDAPGLRPNTSVETWWRSGHYPLADYDFRTVGSAMPSPIAERA